MSADAPQVWLPEWLQRAGSALWVCDPTQRLAFADQRLLGRLGLGDRDLLGAPCHAVLRGADAAGRPICRPGCPAQRLAREHSRIEPCPMRLPTAEGGGWSGLVVFLDLEAPDGSGPWLVHIACDLQRFQRMEDFLRAVASRSRRSSGASGVTPRAVLSPRERVVLDLLSEDLDAHEVARRLHVSYVTVRNHVQHVLRKLDVHSTQEAIALNLLAGIGG